ncbi:hypothetical protein BDV26DRAFT_299062 [Aspergillus bertholletiae]|uniref:Lipoprotein n=1 Tax=Aspergillus bertholletiae TaxID=1226010 RepID=A0A5N7AQF4_9EURO|nr:hypothetical protein BDV26DRAFT_299062 [Aspergillus bertholletiae]
MLFSGAKLLAVAMALTGCAVGAPSTSNSRLVTIGFRRVSEEQAKQYQKAGDTLTLVKEVQGSELGQAVYTTPGRDDWPAGPTQWYCVIQAEEAALKKTDKIWIPEKVINDAKKAKDSKAKNQVIDAYIGQHDKKAKAGTKLNPQETLRMSVIGGSRDHALQMAIPPGLVGKKSPLKTTVHCVPPVIFGPAVNYNSWENVVGNR